MSVLELNDEQVISLVRQLPAARKRTALLALAQEAQVRREERLRFGEEQLRRACAARGLDWEPPLRNGTRDICGWLPA